VAVAEDRIDIELINSTSTLSIWKK
jgi:hypothetical protein